MRQRLQLLIVFVAVVLLSPHSATQAQENWDNYQPRTLKELLEMHRSLPRESEARLHLLFTASFPSLVKLTYTGDKRPIAVNRKEFIAAWAKSRQLSKEIVDLFQEELLFKEDSTEYWLPVQKQVIPFFAQELKKGDSVDLYLIITGARIEQKVPDWIFLVNEFKK